MFTVIRPCNIVFVAKKGPVATIRIESRPYEYTIVAQGPSLLSFAAGGGPFLLVSIETGLRATGSGKKARRNSVAIELLGRLTQGHRAIIIIIIILTPIEYILGSK